MNPYDILDIDENATDEEIKTAYRTKAAQHHPDHGGNAKTFTSIKEAYESIKTADNREMLKAGIKRKDNTAKDVLEKIFSGIIDDAISNKNNNIVEIARTTITKQGNEQIQLLKRKLDMISNTTNILNTMKNKIERDTGMLTNLFDTRIKKMLIIQDETKSQIDFHKKLINEILKELEQYKYKEE